MLKLHGASSSLIYSQTNTLDRTGTVKVDQASYETLRVEDVPSLDESPPEISDLIVMTQRCSQSKNTELANLLYMRICYDGLDTNDALGNYIVPMLVECRDVHEAQIAFNRFSLWNEHSWTALILGHVNCSDFHSAFKIFKVMQKHSVCPTRYTFTALLKGCIELKLLDAGREVHAEVIRESHEQDLYLATILLDMYVKCGLMTDAHDVFNDLPDRDVVSWNALIAGYAEYGPYKEALNLLREMQLNGFSPGEVTYVCCLKACARMRSLDMGRQLHSEIVEKELEENTFLCTTLIDLYATCGCLGEARHVFDKLQCKGVASWNAMILGFVEHGFAEEAMTCFDQMQLEEFPLNDVTVLCALKACASLKDLEKGQTLHAEIAKDGLEREALIPSALVDMYANCGSFAEAQDIFEEISDPDVVLWTALISGYVEHGMSEEALKCLDQMHSNDITPDAVAFICCLSACGHLGCIGKGRDIHFIVICNKLETCDINLSNALIDMYSKCGCMSDAQDVFDRVPERDSVTWTTLISGYSRHGDLDHVLYLFEKMKREGVPPNEITFLAIFGACSHLGLLDTAEYYFADMNRSYGMTPKIGHYNCLVDLLGRAGQLQEAVAKLEDMPYEADSISYGTLLSACQKLGETEIGKQAFDYMMKLNENNAKAFIVMSNLAVEEMDWD